MCFLLCIVFFKDRNLRPSQNVVFGVYVAGCFFVPFGRFFYCVGTRMEDYNVVTCITGDGVCDKLLLRVSDWVFA